MVSGIRPGRCSPVSVVIALLVGVLGFTLAVQLRTSGSPDRLATARQDDLVRLLSDLDAREARLRQEIAELEETRARLESGAQGAEEALAEARRRADAVGILAGVLPAEGPGLCVVLTPTRADIPASALLNAVQELRGAGAEAMQIRDGAGLAVRVVASSYLVDASDGSGIVSDGTTLTAPYTLDVIGDPATMRTALRIPGGVIDDIRRIGGTVAVTARETIAVTALRHDEGLSYAKPTS